MPIIMSETSYQSPSIHETLSSVEQSTESITNATLADLENLEHKHTVMDELENIDDMLRCLEESDDEYLNSFIAEISGDFDILQCADLDLETLNDGGEADGGSLDSLNFGEGKPNEMPSDSNDSNMDPVTASEDYDPHGNVVQNMARFKSETNIEPTVEPIMEPTVIGPIDCISNLNLPQVEQEIELQDHDATENKRDDSINEDHKMNKKESDVIDDSHTQQFRNKRRYACEIENSIYETRQAMKKMKRIHTDKTTNVDELCNRTLMRKEHSSANLQTGTDDASYMCIVCNRSFRYKASFVKHTRIHTDDWFTCKVCNIAYHKGGSPHVCHISEIIPSPQEANENDFHSETDEMDEQESTQVRESYQVVDSNNNESANDNSTYKRKSYTESLLNTRRTFKNLEHIPKEEALKTCKVCHKTVRSAFGLSSHLRSHKVRPTHKCDVCSKSFETRSRLILHSIVHTNDRPYKCTKCNQTFKSFRNLKIHLKRDTGKAAILNNILKRCTVCNKGFNSKCALRSHLTMHTGYMRYNCDVCEMQFRHKSHLTEHSVKHSDEKPYECELCHKSFRLRATLTKHLIKDHNQMPFACHMCNKQFLRKKTFLRHLKEHTDVLLVRE